MLPELKLYIDTVSEFDAGIVDEDLWALALKAADGRELAAKYQYIHLRIESLSAESTKPAVEELCSPTIDIQPKAVKPAEPVKPVKPVKPLEKPQRLSSTKEEEFYSMAISELEEGTRDKLIWRNALKLAEGDTRAAKLHYVCLRIESLCAISASAQQFKQSGT